jgi:hypothetical protein
MTADQRNSWLRLEDAALLRECEQRYFRASGPGGQHRSKVETAIALLHRPSGLTAQAVESRSREVNQRKALRRLREALALQLRCPFDLASPELPPEFAAQRTADGKLAINRENADYPLVLATALDALAAAGGSYAVAAKALGVTTSQVIRFLQADPQVVRRLREKSK